MIEDLIMKGKAQYLVVNLYIHSFIHLTKSIKITSRGEQQTEGEGEADLLPKQGAHPDVGLILGLWDHDLS